MLVEFKTVRTNYEEQFQRAVNERLNGEGTDGPFNEQDYLSRIAIDLSEMVDIEEGVVYLNDVPYPCVYLYNRDGESTRNLLVTYDKAKMLMEKVKSVKILTPEEILN